MHESAYRSYSTYSKTTTQKANSSFPKRTARSFNLENPKDHSPRIERYTYNYPKFVTLIAETSVLGASRRLINVVYPRLPTRPEGGRTCSSTLTLNHKIIEIPSLCQYHKVVHDHFHFRLSGSLKDNAGKQERKRILEQTVRTLKRDT